MKMFSPPCFTFLLPSYFLLSQRIIPSFLYTTFLGPFISIKLSQSIKMLYVEGGKEERKHYHVKRSTAGSLQEFHLRNYCFYGFII